MRLIVLVAVMPNQEDFRGWPHVPFRGIDCRLDLKEVPKANVTAEHPKNPCRNLYL